MIPWVSLDISTFDKFLMNWKRSSPINNGSTPFYRKIQSSTPNMPISYCTCRKYLFKQMAWLLCAHEAENDYLNDIKAECYTKPCQMRNDTTNQMPFGCFNMLVSRYNDFGCIFNFHFQLNRSCQIIVVIILFRKHCSFSFSLF